MLCSNFMNFVNCKCHITVYIDWPNYQVREKSILQVPDTGTRLLENTTPVLRSSIVSFWITPARSKERKYHIFAILVHQNCLVFANTGTFQYLGPELYFFSHKHYIKHTGVYFQVHRGAATPPFVTSVTNNGLIRRELNTVLDIYFSWQKGMEMKRQKKNKTKQNKNIAILYGINQTRHVWGSTFQSGMFPLHSYPPGLNQKVVLFWCQMKARMFSLLPQNFGFKFTILWEI